LNWITFLQHLYRQFPKKNGYLVHFSKIERILVKKLGVAEAVFVLRHEKGLKTIRGKSSLSAPVQKKILIHLNHSLKPWICNWKDDSQWLGFWPVIIGNDWVGCFGLRRKVHQQHLSDEGKKLMELLADRSALYFEERRLWKYLESVDKQSSLSFRTAAMVHEIRGPLTALSALVQLLPEKKGDERFMMSFQQLMLREINRLADMTETFFSFTHPQQKKMALIEFSRIVNQAVELLGPLFEVKRVQLKKKNHLNLFFKCDEQQMESLVLNLLQNALESVNSHGKVEISTALLSRSAYGPGQWMELKVKDNGSGISKENLKRIFDPYFSTRSRGTGLGLAICQRVVENHRGNIKVGSLKQGTVFQIFLPIAQKA
jgi:signal transduction histidine kinase